MGQNFAAYVALLNGGVGLGYLNLDAAGNLKVTLGSEAGGAAVTIADGASVALGAKADAANSLAGAASEIALIKGLQRPLNQTYATVAASQTKQLLGGTGAAGDTLVGLLIVPATTSPGAVGFYDGSATVEIIGFTGGATSVADLKPFFVPINARAKTVATPGWYVTTGTNVSVLAVGNFT